MFFGRLEKKPAAKRYPKTLKQIWFKYARSRRFCRAPRCRKIALRLLYEPTCILVTALSDLRFVRYFLISVVSELYFGYCFRSALSRTALRNALLDLYFFASLSELYLGILWQRRGTDFVLRVFTAVHQLRLPISELDFLVFLLIFLELTPSGKL